MENKRMEFPISLGDIVVKKLSAEELAELAKKPVCVDTVKILFPAGTFENKSYFRGCISKTYAKDRKEGIYKPVIYVNEWWVIYEASWPKTYKGNTLYEITEADRDAILKQIEGHFLAAGITLHKNWPNFAKILRIDFAKTIELPRNAKVAAVLNYLQNADVKHRREIGSVRYNGGGEAIVNANNSRMLCLYNKIAEILKECRKNNTPIPEYILSLIERKVVLMRIEVRLTKPQSIRGEFAKIGIKVPTIRDIFNADFAKGLLNREFNNLVRAVPKQYTAKDYADLQLLHEIATVSSKKSLTQILNAFAISVLERNMTRSELKLQLRGLSDANKARYVLKNIDSQKINIAAAPISEVISHISARLNEWQPLNISLPADTNIAK